MNPLKLAVMTGISLIPVTFLFGYVLAVVDSITSGLLVIMSYFFLILSVIAIPVIFNLIIHLLEVYEETLEE